MEAVLQFENVSYSYSNAGHKIEVLRDASYTFNAGTLYTILGQSGSGKTTALTLAGGLDVPQGGKVLFKGVDIKKSGLTKHRRKYVSLIFQNYNLINYMTAIENVTMAMEISGAYAGKRKEEAMRILKELGLNENEAKRDVRKLSGGQQQRVAIARALATNTEVILADEPTGNLDVETAKGMLEIFVKLAKEYGKCVIVVTHSHEIAARADVVLKFENGKLA
ncbi:MAG: ABC transporter ATP-binding protein [Clostridia bacterium]